MWEHARRTVDGPVSRSPGMEVPLRRDQDGGDLDVRSPLDGAEEGRQTTPLPRREDAPQRRFSWLDVQILPVRSRGEGRRDRTPSLPIGGRGSRHEEGIPVTPPPPAPPLPLTPHRPSTLSTTHPGLGSESKAANTSTNLTRHLSRFLRSYQSHAP